MISKLSISAPQNSCSQSQHLALSCALPCLVSASHRSCLHANPSTMPLVLIHSHVPCQTEPSDDRKSKLSNELELNGSEILECKEHFTEWCTIDRLWGYFSITMRLTCILYVITIHTEHWYNFFKPKLLITKTVLSYHCPNFKNKIIIIHCTQMRFSQVCIKKTLM